MYCKKCGHQLSEEDRFCPNCGAKVEERVNMFAENDFVPPFRQTTHDAQDAGSQREDEDKKPKRNFQFEEFDWDLDGYPSEQGIRKTDDIDFNWESVMDERKKKREEKGTPAFFEKKDTEEKSQAARTPSAEEVSPFTGNSAEEAPAAEEKSLEEEIFGDAGLNSGSFSDTKIVDEHVDLGKTTKIDKFYTYNKKNEEFQALLDQEYRRLKNHTEGEEEPDYGAAAEKIETESMEMAGRPEPPKQADEAPVMEAAVPEVEVVKATYKGGPEYIGVSVPETPANIIAYDQYTEAPADIQTPEIDTEGAMVEAVAIVGPETPETVVAGAENSAVIEKEETEKAETEEPAASAAAAGGSAGPAENKLTFGDVFADDEDETGKGEDGPKKHTFLKVLAVILSILVVILVVIICIKVLAPESAASIKIQDVYNNLFGSVGSLFG